MALSSGRPGSTTGSASRHQVGEKASAEAAQQEREGCSSDRNDRKSIQRSPAPPGALKCPRPSLPTSKLRPTATRPAPAHTSTFASPTDPVPTAPSSSTFRMGTGLDVNSNQLL